MFKSEDLNPDIAGTTEIFNVPSRDILDNPGSGPINSNDPIWNPLPNPRTPPEKIVVTPVPSTVDNEGGSIRIFGIKLFRVTWPKLRPDNPGSGVEEVTQPTVPLPATPTTHTSPDPFKPVADQTLRPATKEVVTPTQNPTPPAVIDSPVPKGKPTGKGRTTSPSP